jgi:hypothetical protein
MTKVKELEERLDQVERGPREEKAYQEGFMEGQREWVSFYDCLPFIFRQTINEYMYHSSERCANSGGSYPSTKEEAMKWFAAVIEKESKLRAQLDGFSRAGIGNTKYKCPNCGVEYFSSLLMAFHQFKNHAITTRQQ